MLAEWCLKRVALAKKPTSSILQNASCEEEQILALPGPDIDSETTETSKSTAGSLAAHYMEGQLLPPHQQSGEAARDDTEGNTAAVRTGLDDPYNTDPVKW